MEKMLMSWSTKSLFMNGRHREHGMFSAPGIGKADAVPLGAVLAVVCAVGSAPAHAGEPPEPPSPAVTQAQLRAIQLQSLVECQGLGPDEAVAALRRIDFALWQDQVGPAAISDPLPATCLSQRYPREGERAPEAGGPGACFSLFIDQGDVQRIDACTSDPVFWFARPMEPSDRQLRVVLARTGRVRAGAPVIGLFIEPIPERTGFAKLEAVKSASTQAAPAATAAAMEQSCAARGEFARWNDPLAAQAPYVGPGLAWHGDLPPVPRPFWVERVDEYWQGHRYVLEPIPIKDAHAGVNPAHGQFTIDVPATTNEKERVVTVASGTMMVGGPYKEGDILWRFERLLAKGGWHDLITPEPTCTPWRSIAAATTEPDLTPKPQKIIRRPKTAP